MQGNSLRQLKKSFLLSTLGRILFSLAIVFFVFAGKVSAQSSCPHNPSTSTDRDWLVVFYCATNGGHWLNNTNWLGSNPINSWRGVSVASSGRIRLALDANRLSGTIPSELGNLSDLSILSLDTNELSGTIPSELGSLSDLIGLSLESNQLTGIIPSELGNLPRLAALSLESNQLTGTIPSELGNLPNMESFLLDSNQLTGTIPSELGNLPILAILSLDTNELSGTIPSELGNLSLLTSLSLAQNQLTGTIPSELGNLPNLVTLSLEDNLLTGSLPSELPNILFINLSGNQLSGTLPSELNALTRTGLLNLAGNRLSGTIPDLDNLRLSNLWLQDNQLTGTIPSELGNTSNYRVLSLAQNQLTGTIPPELGNLSLLARLLLGTNELSGTIPSELGNQRNLRFLSLGKNQLTGTIPPGITNLGRMRSLDLSGNRLSGTLPDFSFRALQRLDLSHNIALRGELQQSLANLTNFTELNIECTGINVPTNTDFQAWLETIDFVGSNDNNNGVICPLGQVTGVTATGGARIVTVRWSLLAGADGYKVQWKSGNQDFNETDRQLTVSGSTTTSTITGLTPGTRYRIRVIATKATADDGTPSDEVTATLKAEPPGQVSGVTATGGIRVVSVKWPPLAGADGYKMQWKSGNQDYNSRRQVPVRITSSLAKLAVTIQSLIPGTEYTMRVIATIQNADDGPPSDEVTATPKADPPGQVSGVNATGGVRIVTVMWSLLAGADGYKIQWISRGQSFNNTDRQLTVSGSTTTRMITGLTPGTTYRIKVRATKRYADDGPPSNEVQGTPKAATPGQVSGVNVTPGVQSLTVSWNSVTNASGYKVQWNSGSQSYNEADRQLTVSGSTTTHTIMGLTAGTEHTIRVIATIQNADNGTPSDEVTATPKAATPGQVSGVNVTPGVQSLTVSWNSVTDASGYKVQWNSGSQSYNETNRQLTVSGSTTTRTITGLTPGTRYRIRVTATRANADDSPPSSVVPGTPKAATPGRVSGVNVTPGVQSLTVSWNSVTNADGYRVQWKSGDQSYSDQSYAAVMNQMTVSGSTTTHTIMGLTAGTEHTIRVIATRANAYDGPPSNEVPGTPKAATPGQVSGVNVTPGVQSLTVSWNSVTDASGYKVQWNSGSQSYNETNRQLTVSGSTTTRTITGLTPGTRYRIRVTATRANADDSPPSSVVLGTPKAATPGRVSGVNVTPGVQSLTVSWNSVTNADGYRVQWKSGDQSYSDQSYAAVMNQMTVSGSTTTHTIMGLTAGTEHTIRVIAIRANANHGQPSNEVPGTPSAAAPGRVSGVNVTPGVQSLTVSWNSVTNADGYRVQWKSESQSYNETNRQLTVSGSTTTRTITGLTPGTRYRIRVTATRANADDGPPSNEIPGTPKAATPGRVSGVNVTPGVQSLTVSWNSVTNASGYRVQWKSGDQSYSDQSYADRMNQLTVSGSTTTRTITGLTAGTEHTIRVTATRANADNGPPSNEVPGTPSAATPGRVSGVNVTPGVQSLTVSWNSVTNADGYRVQWKSESQSYNETNRQLTVSGSTTTRTITGLTAGTRYRIRVIATRANADDSPPSNEIPGTPKAATPGRVSGVNVTPGVQSLTVSWNSVTNASGYRVQWKSESQSYNETNRQLTVSGSTTTRTITGLTAGTEHTIRVTATRANADNGPPSNEVPGTPSAAAPGRVSGVDVTPGVQSLTVSWNSVTNASGYRVQWKSGGQVFNETDRQLTVSGSTTTRMITGLTAGTRYRIRVTATRANADDGPPSNEVPGTPSAAAPGQVSGVDVTPGVQSLTVSWNSVTNASGYRVQWKSESQSYNETNRQLTVSGSTTTRMITGLTAGTTYRIRVIATMQNADDGLPSDEVTATPRAAAPGQVPGVNVTPGVQSLTVSWNSVTNASGYRVQWKSGGQVFNETDRQLTVSGSTTTRTITGLTAGTTYRIRVIATRVNADDGPPSDEVPGTPKAATPGLVSGVDVTPGVQSLTVSWNSVTNASGYKVQWKSGSQVFNETDRQLTVSGSTTTRTITGLTAGTTYRIRVIATMQNADDGPPSDEVPGTPRAAAPGLVSGVDVTPGVQSLTVSWNSVTNASGYKVQWKSGSQVFNETDRQLTVSGSTTTRTITGLTAGTTYRIRVIATRVNADDGPPSDEVPGTPRAAAPGLVSGVDVTPGVQSLTVSWNSATNASAYKVQWKSGSQIFDETDRQLTTVSRSTTTRTITGLTAGTEHTIRVIATRANADDGPPSNEVTATPKTDPSGRVSGVNVTPGVQSLTVSWNSVTNASAYKVQWKSGSQNFKTGHQMTVSRSTTTRTITGLTAGTIYRIRVIATRVNADDGPPSDEVPGTPRAAAPGLVSGVDVTPGVQSLTVSWNSATNASAYKVQWKSGSQIFDETDRQLTTVSRSTTTRTITGLTAGTEHTIRVIATRANADDGPPSNEVTATPKTDPSGRVSGVNVTPGVQSLTVSWNSVTNASAYKVQWKSGSQNFKTGHQMTVSRSTTTRTITGLTPGTRYRIRVIATRANADDGPPSNEVSGTPRAAAPGRVSGVDVTPGVQSLTVSWNSATNASAYKVQWKSGSQNFKTGHQLTVSRSTTTRTITGLTAGTEHTIRVIATRTNADDGQPSNEVPGTPILPDVSTKTRIIILPPPPPPPPPLTIASPQLLPDQVSGVEVTPGVQSLIVSWDSVTDASNYKVQWKSGSQDFNETDRQNTTTDDSYTITGLTAGTEYTIRVIATRENANDGPPSLEVTGIPNSKMDIGSISDKKSGGGCAIVSENTVDDRYENILFNLFLIISVLFLNFPILQNRVRHNGIRSRCLCALGAQKHGATTKCFSTERPVFISSYQL